MRRLLLIAALAAMIAPMALIADTNLTTVTGRITDRGGSPLKGFVQFQPTGPTISNNGQLVGNNPVIMPLTAGAFTTNLVPSRYNMVVPSIATPLVLTVPPGGGSYDFLSITTDVSEFIYSTNRWGQISARILPGTNMVFQTNFAGLPNETVTISATGCGGGSGQTNDTTKLNANEGVGTNLVLYPVKNPLFPGDYYPALTLMDRNAGGEAVAGWKMDGGDMRGYDGDGNITVEIRDGTGEISAITISAAFLNGDGSGISNVTASSITDAPWLTQGTADGLYDTNGAALASARLATNLYPWGVLYDPAGAASAATGALGSAAFKATGFFDLAGAGTSAAQAATNALGTAAWKASTFFDTNGAAAAAQSNSLPLHGKADTAGTADIANAVSASVSNAFVLAGTVAAQTNDTTKLDANGGAGTNLTFYGSAAKTNWTFTDVNGWHQTNSGKATGMNVSQGMVTYWSNGVQVASVNMANGGITASNFTGPLAGNAVSSTTAGSATNDSLGRTIAGSYAPLAGTNTFTGTNSFTGSKTLFGSTGQAVISSSGAITTSGTGSTFAAPLNIGAAGDNGVQIGYAYNAGNGSLNFAAPFGSVDCGVTRSGVGTITLRTNLTVMGTGTFTNGNFFPQGTNTAPTAAIIGGTVGSITNHLMKNVGGALMDYWSDGTTLYSKQIAP